MGGVCVGVHHCGWCFSDSFLGGSSDFYLNWFCGKIISTWFCAIIFLWIQKISMTIYKMYRNYWKTVMAKVEA